MNMKHLQIRITSVPLAEQPKEAFGEKVREASADGFEVYFCW